MKNTRIAVVAVWLMSLAVLPGCSGPAGADAEFAKKAFAAMSNNDSSAEDYIDWENFTAVGQDVGPMYQSMTSETDRAEFRKGFLIGFSQSFTGTGADASKLSNWTVVSESPSGTVVSAKAPNGNKLLITVTKRNGKQLISSLNLDM